MPTSGTKRKFCKDFLGIFKILEYPFLSEYFQKSVYSGECIRATYEKGAALNTFPGCFPEFLVQLFQKTFMKLSMM